jgi:dCMP deaminase
MDIAERVSQMSHAVRLKVGSVLVKNGNIISFGWNGTPSGWDNTCEDEIVTYDENDLGFGQWSLDLKTKQYRALKTRPEVIHSESNCLMKVARSTESSEGATMFCTHAPCIDCAKLIYQSGINTLYYRNTYRSQEGLEFLKKSGVNVHRYSQENS